MKPDSDTQKILTEGEHLQTLTMMAGWGIVKSKLMDKIVDLQSVNNITTEDPNEIILDIKVRKNVISLVLEWIKEIEGIADQHSGNKTILEDMDHVIRK